jgi:hypothetical protein
MDQRRAAFGVEYVKPIASQAETHSIVDPD